MWTGKRNIGRGKEKEKCTARMMLKNCANRGKNTTDGSTAKTMAMASRKWMRKKYISKLNSLTNGAHIQLRFFSNRFSCMEQQTTTQYDVQLLILMSSDKY